ncbi:MAG: response regulator [Clostridiales bacterium]|nr:response regulator [Clostridiales bacterium]
MNSRKNASAAMLAVIIGIVLIVGGTGYVKMLENSVWNQLVSETLDMTSMGAHAFEIYVDKDMQVMDTLTADFSKISSSSDSNAILDRMSVFSESIANYTLIDLDNKMLYSNRLDAGHPLTDTQALIYESLEGDSGVGAPYMNDYNNSMTLGYYKKFTFSDGTRGILEKGQLLSNVASEFSLSYYDGQGHSYIVDRLGKILVRPNYKGERSFLNIFDVIEDYNDEEAVEAFRESLVNHNTDTAGFVIDGVEQVVAYVPLNGTDDWYYIAVVPDSALMQHAGEILNTSRTAALVVGAVCVLGFLFWLLINKNSKEVREKEKEIYHRDQLFEILANNTDDAFIMISDRTLEVEYVSPNTSRIFGVSGSNLKKRFEEISNMITFDDNRSVFDIIGQMSSDGTYKRNGYIQNEERGERVYFLEKIYKQRVDDEDKSILVFYDRTLETKNRKMLEEALEIAKVANEAKSTFLSNMSHDIRAPMSAIVGFAALLEKDTEQPEKVRSYTGKIISSSQHLLGLINDVLDMSKIESGKTTLNIAEFELPELVREVATIVRTQSNAKKQSFDISVKDVVHEHLSGDKLRINQILINILTNAVKYTPVGGEIKLEIIELPQKTKNFSRLRFVVSDNGIGISEEYMKNIFKPFTRETGSMTNKVQGTGLGMAITSNLVELMGGTIHVDSKQGEGSTFTVELEIRINKQDIDEDFWEKHGATHILVVDDDEDTCKGILTAMEGTGVETEYVLDGYSAVSRVKEANNEERDFNFVLIDWKMPGMDGLETAAEIRKILPGDVPIMILSAYDWSEIELKALEMGITGFLPKPFFLTNFKRVVESIREKENGDKTEAEEKNALSGLNVLAAEDNELNSELLYELLTMSGARCEIVENGKEAVLRFESSDEGEFDLILMDVQMPVMNGYEATEIIRKSGHINAKDIIIIAMTANAFAEDVKAALDSGMDAHIAKPIDMDRLEETLSGLLKERGKG